jgi:hypothetical protein
MSWILSKLTYANVMATAGVFIALGGTSYAVTQLPKNSVGTKQIRSNAVTGAKVKNGSLTAADFAQGQQSAGAAGPQGSQGPQGPQGEQGPKGEQGPPGQPDTSKFYDKDASDARYLAQTDAYTKTQADERYALGKFRSASAYVPNGVQDQKVLDVAYRGWIGVTCNRDAGNSVVRFHPADQQGAATRVWTDEGNGAYPSWMGHYLTDPATFPKATMAADDKLTFDIMAPSGAGVFVITVHNETYVGGGCNVVARYHGA